MDIITYPCHRLNAGAAYLCVICSRRFWKLSKSIIFICRNLTLHRFVENFLYHFGHSVSSERINSLTSRLFVQTFVQANNKDIIKVPLCVGTPHVTASVSFCWWYHYFSQIYWNSENHSVLNCPPTGPARHNIISVAHDKVRKIINIYIITCSNVVFLLNTNV